MATRGRKTKYDPELHPKQALKYSLLGLTDSQMAGAFDISESTLNLWKKKYTKFSESIVSGKTDADANVASTLYKRALGHLQKRKVAFKVRQIDEKTGKLYDAVEVVEIEDYHPPSDQAINLWLGNRQRKKWGSKSEVEHSGELKGKTTIVFSKGAKGKD